VLKEPVATNKLQCVAPTAALKRMLTPALDRLSIPVSLVGENIGVDFAVGGRLRARPVQQKRFRSPWKRRARISWWRRQRGDATNVARAGVRPSVQYGADSIGITNTGLLCLRRIYGAAVGISCGGSSLTARLALGGSSYVDLDPAVTDANPPLMALAARLWDDPTVRVDFVKAWSAARRDAQEYGHTWHWVRGPVGAAWASLLRIEAEWPSPFVVRLLGHEVSLVDVPPRQVAAILRAHARRYLDIKLIGRLLEANVDWDADAIREQYKHGIDWA
jgi:hypothetical protein